MAILIVLRGVFGMTLLYSHSVLITSVPKGHKSLVGSAAAAALLNLRCAIASP